MADTFQNIIDIKPVLQNTKDYKEQMKVLKERFPGKYRYFEEDGRLVIVDKATGEEAYVPKSLPTKEDYYSPEAIAGRQKSAKERWPEAALPAAVIAAPLGVPVLAEILAAGGAPATASKILPYALSPTIKQTADKAVVANAIGNATAPIADDPSVMWKEPVRTGLPIAGAVMGGRYGSKVGQGLSKASFLGFKAPANLLRAAGGSVGGGTGAYTGLEMAEDITGEEISPRDRMTTVGAGMLGPALFGLAGKQLPWQLDAAFQGVAQNAPRLAEKAQEKANYNKSRVDYVKDKVNSLINALGGK